MVKSENRYFSHHLSPESSSRSSARAKRGSPSSAIFVVDENICNRILSKTVKMKKVKLEGLQEKDI